MLGGNSESLFDKYLMCLVLDLELNMTYDRASIPFLDTWISITREKLISDLFTKPTDRNQLLHFTSFHPLGIC